MNNLHLATNNAAEPGGEPEPPISRVLKSEFFLAAARLPQSFAGKLQVSTTFMSNETELSAHWRFAAGNAFRALETQVREFDFAKYSNGHTYSGLKPQEYIEIVDGFLSEDAAVIPAGNRRALEELRKLIVHHIAAAFDVGWHTAIENWNDGETEYASLPTPQLNSMARAKSPFSGVKQEWFVEGYCQSWAQSELESLRKPEPPGAS